MNPKEYLQQIRKCDNQINNKLAEIVHLREMATSITSTLKEDVVQSDGGSKSRVSEAIDKIIDLEKEVNADIDNLVNLKREIMSVIDEIEPQAYKDILYKRYFQFKTWEQIAAELGFSYQWVCKLHGYALKKVKVGSAVCQ